MNNKFNLYNQTEQQPPISLKKVKQACGLITLMTEQEFKRFLGVLENDFPDAIIVYQTVSMGKLWIMRGSPNEAPASAV